MVKWKDGTPETGSHWEWDVEWGKPIICVDFHHTITTRCGACDGGDIKDFITGVPQEGVTEALKELSKTFRILIFTGSGSFWKGKKLQMIVDWLDKHKIPYDDIRFDKPPAAFIIDDRSVHHRSWSETLKEINKRINMR